MKEAEVSLGINDVVVVRRTGFDDHNVTRVSVRIERGRVVAMQWHAGRTAQEQECRQKSHRRRIQLSGASIKAVLFDFSD